jgi:hypothetical protein
MGMIAPYRDPPRQSQKFSHHYLASVQVGHALYDVGASVINRYRFADGIDEGSRNDATLRKHLGLLPGDDGELR